MAKRTITEINEQKQWHGRHTSFLAGELLSFQSVLKSKKNREPEETLILEEIRWSLVPIVSIFESFYKEIFVRYIDSGEPFISRASDLQIKERKVEIDKLIELSKKQFTIGELISYSLSYSSFKDIRKNYETLCDEDYMDHIQNAELKLIQQDATEFNRAKEAGVNLFQSVNSIFSLRHMLIHEFPATKVIVKYDEAMKYFDHSWLLLMATDRLSCADTHTTNPFHFGQP